MTKMLHRELVCLALFSIVVSEFWWYCRAAPTTESEYHCYSDNEVFDQCGPACPATCDLGQNEELGCVAMCVPSCVCKEGNVRNRWGVCIPKDKCPHAT